MSLSELLQSEAERRSLWPKENPADARLDIPSAFYLVRDMPYGRASSREPRATIREWRGTCSGKHYLLQAVFAEMGIDSRLIACTHRLTRVDASRLPAALRPLLEQGPFVDVHNYLVAETPQGRMVIDATWPLPARKLGVPVNEQFVWGVDMQIACVPIDSYEIPDDRDPQAFKEELLRQHFSAAELKQRELFIEAVSRPLP
jgi:hypothetical protein